MATGTLVMPTPEEKAPIEPVSPEEAKEPQAPTPFDIIMARFDALDKRYEQLGTAVVKISERLEQPAEMQITPGAPGNPLGSIGQIIDLIKTGLGQGEGGSNDYFAELYKHAHENYDNKVLFPALNRLAGAEVRHVTG